ncbi:MAG: hypothetical protein ACFFB4_00545 [Promethearchaeota archaeon]
MQRALKYDGLIPTIKYKQGKFEDITPECIREIKDYIKKNRTVDSPFDIIVEGETLMDDLGTTESIIRPFAEAGATWWIESNWTTPDLNKIKARIKKGPPPLK